MSKKKPLRKTSINNAINELASESKEILSRKTEVELIEINKINELKLDNDILMHNRISYSKSKLLELASNIQSLANNKSGILETGILNPVMLRRKNGLLERIHGENRIKALKLNNQKFVPAIIIDNVSDDLARFMRSSENLNREDLNAYDETLSILEHIQLACNFESIESVKKFINKIKNFHAGKSSLNEEEKDLHIKVSEVFEKIGRFDIITFVDRLSVLKLNEIVKQALVDEIISYSQAKVINSKLSEDKDITKIINILKSKSLSVNELKKFIANMIEVKDDKLINKVDDPITDLKSLTKLITKKKYNSQTYDTRIYIDNKLDEVKKILEDINTKLA